MRNVRRPLMLLPWLILSACHPESEPSPAEAPAEATGQTSRLLRAESPVPGQYVVVLAPLAMGEPEDVPALAEALASKHGGQVLQVYQKALRGFSVRMTEAQAIELARHPAVASIEEDAVVRDSLVQSPPGNWGLDRIDQRTLPLDNQYTYFGTGAGVHAYLISSGIRTTHTDLGGRATADFNNIPDGNSSTDCNGVGTHWATVIGGNTYGVAKGARLHSVRVLDCVGSGTLSNILAGVDWVTVNHIKPAVALLNLNMTSVNTTLEAVVRNSIAQGVTYVSTAGIRSVDACTSSPARMPELITVGFSRNTDAVAPFSNFGGCVDLFAPGDGITGGWFNSDTALNTIGGGVGAAVATGAAALWLEVFPTATPASVSSMLTSHATTGALTPTPTAPTPDRLLYTGFIGSRLRGGTAVSGIPNRLGDMRFFRLEVPAGTTRVTFTTSGGTGDVDLYVRAGALPSLSVHDCAPYLTGNAETCTLNSPAAGPLYVMLHGFASFSGVSLSTTVTP